MLASLTPPQAGLLIALVGVLAGWGLATGAILYLLIERTHLIGFTPDPEAPGAEKAEKND